MKSKSVQHNATILAKHKKKQREAAKRGKQPLTEHKKKYQELYIYIYIEREREREREIVNHVFFLMNEPVTIHNHLIHQKVNYP